jgi:MFS family permease
VSRPSSFVRFYVADAVSNLGTFVSTLAIQLLLITELGADQTQVGLVRFAQWLPYLLFGLLAGVVVDRLRRRPVLVAADIVCAAALGAVGVLTLTGHASVLLVAVAMFLVGAMSMFFTAAHQSYLPTLVPLSALPTASARIEQIYSATQSAGPLLGGALVKLLSAPVAVLVDAASYAVSAVVLASIRTPEPRPAPAADRHVLREVQEGAHFVYRHTLLGPYAVALHATFFFNAAVTTVLVYFAVSDLHLDAVAVGLVLAASGVTGVLAAGAAPRVAEAIGLGRAHVLGTWLWAVGWVPLLWSGAGPRAIVGPVAASLVVGLGSGLSSPLTLSYRNAVTPPRLRGRMNGTIRTFNWGSIAVAAPLGGWLAASTGNRTAIAVGVLGLVATAVGLSLSPFRRAEMPTEQLVAGAG